MVHKLVYVFHKPDGAYSMYSTNQMAHKLIYVFNKPDGA